MRTWMRKGLSLMLALMLTAGICLALAEGNPTIEYSDSSIVAGEIARDDARYVIVMQTGNKASNPKSLLVSGVLLAPEGTEISRAWITFDDQTNAPAWKVVRYETAYTPENPDSLTFTPDMKRSGFAFLADVTGSNLPDGEVGMTVSLKLGEDEAPVELRYTAELSQDAPVYEDEQAAVEALHPTTLVITNDGSGSDGGNAVAEIPAATPEEEKGFFQKVLDTLTGTVSIGSFVVPLWMLIAAGALLVLIVIALILIISGAKKKKAAKALANLNSELKDFSSSPFKTSQDGGGEEQTPPDLNETTSNPDAPAPGIGILSIGDEDTVDLEALQKQNAGILFAGDEATTDIKVTGYPVQFELVFRDEFMKTEATIPEDAQIVIGRGGEATIQTNPGDTSVSHRHGVFSVRNGQVCYTDQSRNGTRYNGQRTLRKGDTIALPFGTIVYLEVGAHTVKVRANHPA